MGADVVRDEDELRAKAEAWDRVVEAAGHTWQTATGLGIKVRLLVAEHEADRT
jgi:hypothetical protein